MTAPYGDYPYVLTSPSLPWATRLELLETLVSSVDHARDLAWITAEHTYITEQMRQHGATGRCPAHGVCVDPDCPGHPSGGGRHALGVPVDQPADPHP